MPFRHPRHTLSGFGAFTAGTSLPLTARFRLCVRRVASLGAEQDLEIEDQSSCATYSATGATSLRHVSEVSQSLIANDDVIRQFPLRSSQKSRALRGSRRSSQARRRHTWVCRLPSSHKPSCRGMGYLHAVIRFPRPYPLRPQKGELRFPKFRREN